MTGVQLTIVVMMVCLTCHYITEVGGQQSTEAQTFISRSEVDEMIRAARREITDEVMRTARQEMIDNVMRTARHETEELREALSDVTGKLEEQNTIIKKLGLENLEMKQIIEGEQAEQKVQIEGQQAKIEGQQVHIEGQHVKFERQQVQIETFEREQVVMTQKIEELIAADKRHDDESQQIAFSVVSHHNFGPVSPDDTNVEYEIVHTNIGGGWLPLANAFQAPVDGVYMFSASMVSSSSSTQTVYCHIVHNTPAGQTTVASMYGRSDSSGDANSVIIELAEDDVVSVQLMANDGILSSSSAHARSTFSGFLLFM